MTSAEDSPDGSMVNLLLAGAHPDDLPSLEAALDCPHRNLVKAQAGEEVLRHLDAADFAAIVLAGPDGLATARHLRSLARSRATPLLFLIGPDEADFPHAEVHALEYADCLPWPSSA